MLLWLSIDGLLREKSGGGKSLDDFARSFFGTDDGSRVTRTYTFDDICSALNRIAPYDWAAFLHERLDTHADTHLLDGLTRAGYRLIFTDTPTESFRQTEADSGNVDLGYSIGPRHRHRRHRAIGVVGRRGLPRRRQRRRSHRQREWRGLQ